MTFRGCDFSEVLLDLCEFDRCVFRSCRFAGTVFRRCSVTNCSFPYASLFNVTFDECRMMGSSLAEASVSALTPKGGNWSFTALNGLDLSRIVWEGASFEGADLRECKLSGCVFSRCSLSGALLTNADLTKADLRGTRTDGVDFLHLKMKDTKIDLEQAVLIAEALGARFCGEGNDGD